MTDTQFRALLDLVMCSDPWPVNAANQVIVWVWMDIESIRRGYTDWVDAYHHFRFVAKCDGEDKP
jgi:hypothetical protein